MMTPAQFVLCLTCLLLGKMVQKIHLTSPTSSVFVKQESGFKSTHVGDNITLRCFYTHSTLLFWYMQPLGEKPKLISTFYVSGKVITFHHNFKSHSRFTLDTENGNHHLTISDLKISDSATYYCAVSAGMVLTFAEGAIVSVKGSDFNVQALVRQSTSQTISPGAALWLTLNCAVHNVKSDGKENLYRFKDSKEAHPGLIHTHGERNDQYERKPDTCAYNLAKENLNVSHAGNFYCAVALCGHILFGNETKLESSREVDSVLVYSLTGTLIFTTVLVIVLIITVYNMNERKCCLSTEARFPASPTVSKVSKNHAPDSPQYAALDLNQLSRSRRKRSDTKTECVYSSVNSRTELG